MPTGNSRLPAWNMPPRSAELVCNLLAWLDLEQFQAPRIALKEESSELTDRLPVCCALDQALMLRGSREFPDSGEYQTFPGKLFSQLRQAYRDGSAPAFAYAAFRHRKAGAGTGDSGTLISVERNSYSANGRLVGDPVEARMLRGESKSVRPAEGGGDTATAWTTDYRIDYRHVIDWLRLRPFMIAVSRRHCDFRDGSSPVCVGW